MRCIESFHQWQRTLQEPSLSILLFVQVFTVFIVAPIPQVWGAHFEWTIHVSILAMAILSIFIVGGSATTIANLLSLVLGVMGIWLGPHLAASRSSALIITSSALLFMGGVSVIVGKKIAIDDMVTSHQIRGAVIIYLNIALAFGYIDNFLGSYFPGAYSNVADPENSIGKMIYFSLVTLTTIGYGDIIPIHPYARSLATLEAVIGQFYIATLIGTLVGLHVSYRQQKYTERKKIP